MRTRSLASGIGALAALALMLLPAPDARAATCAAEHVRWASTSNTIYVTGPVECTLTAIQALVPKAPLTLVDPVNHLWLLKANLRFQEGATLPLHGSAVGGDVDELRLASNNQGSPSMVFVRAHWGTVDIRSTRITSWDEAANGPDTNTANGRSFLQVKSFLDADGVTPRESRMDIRDSDVGYLGYFAAESYGLSWKVLGLTEGIYDTVNVSGDIVNSRLHHNYFGAYMFGAFGMQVTGNEVDHNTQYGLDPHDDSDSLLIENNTVHHNGNHGIICSKRCDHLTIRNNASTDNVGNGIMLHRLADDSLVEGNQTLRNTDSGIALFDAHRNVVRNNTIQRNLRGIRFSVGSSENVVTGNDIRDNATGLYFFKGTDAPTLPGNDGRPKGNRLEGNTIADSGTAHVILKDADANTFTGNSFAGNGNLLSFERGRGNLLDGNTLPASATLLTKGSSGAPATTDVANQSSTLRVTLGSLSTVTFKDVKSRIFDTAKGLATAVSPSGSSLALTPANAGSDVTVTARDLWATVTGGSARITPTTWGTSGTGEKTWTTQVPKAGQRVRYLVGQLTPGKVYVVKKNGNQIEQKTANGSGQIAFENGVGRTTPVTYSVRPKK